MQVTEVRMYKSVNPANSSFKASATVTLDDAIAIHNIAVIEGRDGLFLSFPDRRNREGRFVDIAHPVNRETRAMIQEAVLRKYHEEEQAI